MVVILFGRFCFRKMWKNMEKWLFFLVAMAGLGNTGWAAMHVQP